MPFIAFELTVAYNKCLHASRTAFNVVAESRSLSSGQGSPGSGTVASAISEPACTIWSKSIYALCSFLKSVITTPSKFHSLRNTSVISPLLPPVHVLSIALNAVIIPVQARIVLVEIVPLLSDMYFISQVASLTAISYALR